MCCANLTVTMLEHKILGGKWVSAQGRRAALRKGVGEMICAAASQQPHLAGLVRAKETCSVSNMQINVSESLNDAGCGAHGCSA